MADFIPAESVQAKKVQWLWKGRVPSGMLSVIAGRPDQGKGLMACHLAAAVSRAGGRVIYSAIEDPVDVMTRPRLQAAGADLSKVAVNRFWLPSMMEELETMVLEEDVRLVILDPWAAHLVGVSRYSDRIRSVLTPLSELAEAGNTAITILDHALKKIGPHSHPLQGIGGGSSGLPSACRMAFIFGTDPSDQDRKVMCCVKSNLAELPKPLAFEVDTAEVEGAGQVPTLVLQGETSMDAKRLLVADEATKMGRKPDKLAQACEWLSNYLFNAPDRKMPSGMVLEDGKQYGLTQRTMRRAAEEVGVEKIPPGGGPKCEWRLPDQLFQIMGGKP